MKIAKGGRGSNKTPIVTGKDVTLSVGIEDAGELVWHPITQVTTKTVSTGMYQDDTQYFGEDYPTKGKDDE